MLEVTDLYSGYGRIEILRSIHLKVPAGQIISLIGANGAGKTTFLMTLSGIVKARKGTIHFEGRSVEKLPPDELVKLGIVQVPEGRRIFTHLTVAENLELGAYLRRDQEISKDRLELLDLFPILKDRARMLAGNLSGGEQQMLAMARALMARPRLLLLDEPSLGLAPKMIDVVFNLIRRINERGITILLVEQNAFKALNLAHHAYVIESGKIKLEGPGKELLANPIVKKAYLGES
ncbi:MAG: ABC transporter ATP-binding protein [Omnitrophica bacterium GWA2_52_12]|nr:MAG: ABC transporter ATP-binding protein [Omnitrophica bacterium GWA2_52_12]